MWWWVLLIVVLLLAAPIFHGLLVWRIVRKGIRLSSQVATSVGIAGDAWEAADSSPYHPARSSLSDPGQPSAADSRCPRCGWSPVQEQAASAESVGLVPHLSSDKGRYR
ncbi:MAG: hypothetical protein ACRC35_09365 [Angustibacter sp.]